VGSHARRRRAPDVASRGAAARVPPAHFVAALALALGLIHPDPAAARKAALLVGVSNYPFLPPENSLKGPRSDVVLMRDQVLPQLGFGPADIRVLADGVPGAAQPTKAAVDGEVKRLIAGAASTGTDKIDTVVIYLSGHGSIQPAKPEDIGKRSLDGFDAIFLPTDTKPGSLGRPDGVIVNAQIADWVKQLRGNGAFVWLIVDSCHSGYINRDLKSSSKAHDRFVSPETLGIKREDLDAAARLAATKLQARSRDLKQSDPDLASPGTGADYVGFFAAQSTETTPEYPMPDDASAIQGLFTYTLAQVVLGSPGASFAQFRDALLRRYAELQRPPTPMFVGTGLNKNFFGVPPAVRQWPMSRQDSRVVVGAGQLQGLSVGSLLAVLDDPTAPDDKAKGYVKVTAAHAFDSDVSPVEHKGLKEIDPAAADKATARLVEPGIPLVLRVGVPTPATTADASNGQVSQALAALRAPGRLSDRTSAHIEWVEGETGGRDVTLVVDSGRVWFAGADGSFVANGFPGRPQTYSVPLSGDTSALAGAIWDTLQRIARTTNLARLAAEFAELGLCPVNAGGLAPAQRLAERDVDLHPRPGAVAESLGLREGGRGHGVAGQQLPIELGGRGIGDHPAIGQDLTLAGHDAGRTPAPREDPLDVSACGDRASVVGDQPLEGPHEVGRAALHHRQSHRVQRGGDGQGLEAAARAVGREPGVQRPRRVKI